MNVVVAEEALNLKVFDGGRLWRRLTEIVRFQLTSESVGKLEAWSQTFITLQTVTNNIQPRLLTLNSFGCLWLSVTTLLQYNDT